MHSGEREVNCHWGYAAVMGFAPAYTAEHYVFDVLLGWAPAAAVYATYRIVDARHVLPRNARREAARVATAVTADPGPARSRS